MRASTCSPVNTCPKVATKFVTKMDVDVLAFTERASPARISLSPGRCYRVGSVVCRTPDKNLERLKMKPSSQIPLIGATGSKSALEQPVK